MRKVIYFSLLVMGCSTLPGRAANIFTLKDLHARERQELRNAQIYRMHIAQREPSYKPDKARTATAFLGKGYKLGGDKYVNRLLNIDRKEGKKMYHNSRKN